MSKRVLVTGGAGGLGKLFARDLIDMYGASVTLAGRSPYDERIQGILDDTAEDLATANALKRRADDAKAQAEQILQTAQSVMTALERAASAQDAARASGQETTFGAQAAERFREFAESGSGDLDFSAIYRVIRGERGGRTSSGS